MRDYLEGLKAASNKIEYIIDNKTESIKLLAVAIALVTVALLLLYRGGDEVDIVETARTVQSEDAREHKADQDLYTDSSEEQQQISTGDIYVDIGGAVKTPMLVKLPVGSRVDDAIQKAGGIAEDADLTTINRAELLVDGQKIYIPRTGETGVDDVSSQSLPSGSGSVESGKVNINTADSAQLQTLTGVGPATAQKILDYRTQNGRFNSIEDLKNVSGIGDKTFEKMRDQVVV